MINCSCVMEARLQGLRLATARELTKLRSELVEVQHITVDLLARNKELERQNALLIERSVEINNWICDKLIPTFTAAQRDIKRLEEQVTPKVDLWEGLGISDMYAEGPDLEDLFPEIEHI